MAQIVSLDINGITREVMVRPDQTLFDVLRNELDLTGVKEGCDRIGECGTCTVIMDGHPVLSCLVLAVDAKNKKITTVEGLSAGVKLDPIQEAFIEHGALQCGFCAPGMMMTTKAFLDENPAPSEAEIRDALKGNLCRCTGYTKIVEAVQSLASQGKEVI
jgi:aerobic carbon-monoxide dehydrogenase small subunit